MRPQIINLFPLFLIFGILYSTEIEVKEIPLSGPITNPKQEISGMDWYGKNLILLPENLEGFLYMISETEIKDVLNLKRSDPILPQQIKFSTPDYSSHIDGFDGFEAIAFDKNNVYITIESESNHEMVGYLVWGKINPDNFIVNIPIENLKKIKTPSQVKNITFESILIEKKRAILLYEANGLNIQKKAALQPSVTLKDKTITNLIFPNIEYRITDATKIDQDNRFWVINYYWPGDKKTLKPGNDLITEKFPKGKTHQISDVVERLIELQVKDQKIIYSGQAPIQLKLDGKKARNWEGIVRLNDDGFIIATDKYPLMILGFVPKN